jgi:sugar phosphate isomerase/epimerase
VSNGDNDPLEHLTWALWCGTLGFDSELTDRFKAAAMCGCSKMSITPLDADREIEAGRSLDDVAVAASDCGVELILDAVIGWDKPMDPTEWVFAQYDVDVVLRFAEKLRVGSITAAGMPTSRLSGGEKVEEFRRLCAKAADIGCNVQLEFMPMTSVPNLEDAWQIVKESQDLNPGLVFDTWHFFRGHPDFEMLASVPSEKIIDVQVSDGRMAPSGTLWEDTRNRLLPGEGDFELERVIAALAESGALRTVGPEVMSPTLWAMPPLEAAQTAFERVRSLLSRVLGDDSGKDTKRGNE